MPRYNRKVLLNDLAYCIRQSPGCRLYSEVDAVSRQQTARSSGTLPLIASARKLLDLLLKLLLLFTIVPVVELALLIEAGQYLGVLPTVLVVLGTGFAGAVLARTQGLRALRRLQQAVADGRFPGEEIFDGVLILSGGLLLLTPGFFTDVIGLLALIPGSRALVKAAVENAVRRRLQTGAVHERWEPR